jgi:DNA-3-methyladenine glycosylase
VPASHPSKALPREFYARDTVLVARELLGTVLVRQLDGERRAGTIVETEAYAGPDDRASHARSGPMGRARLMWGEAGTAYVYLIYGMYDCVNAVTERVGYPGAVLIRALEPIEGLADRTDGPGRLCRAMAIDRRLNGEPLTGDQLWIEPGPVRDFEIAAGPRIGVEYAGDWATRPWRFWVAGNRWVSRAAPRR